MNPHTPTRNTILAQTILFVRLPGLLAHAARSSRTDYPALCPVVVSEGRLIRDACPLALAQGVRVGAGLVQARRLCPALLAVPLEQVDASALRHRFLELLAALSPVVEPVGLEAAYADLTGSVDLTSAPIAECPPHLVSALASLIGLTPVVGIGHSRLAAQACAESQVASLTDASVDFLWPDDPAVPARLRRLGLHTFGQAADVGEEALRLHFGKYAPLLYHRAHGVDLTPIRALYPPPFAEVVIDCTEDPVDTRERLDQVLARAGTCAARQLQGLGVGRKLILEVRTERGETRREWAVPAPLAHAQDIQRAAWRLLAQTRLTAPVTGVRLRIEDVSFPVAHTSDLFGVRADVLSLDATRRRLAARFGLTTLVILGAQPRTERQKRRAAVQESVEAFGKTVSGRMTG